MTGARRSTKRGKLGAPQASGLNTSVPSAMPLLCKCFPFVLEHLPILSIITDAQSDPSSGTCILLSIRRQALQIGTKERLTISSFEARSLLLMLSIHFGQ